MRCFIKTNRNKLNLRFFVHVYNDKIGEPKRNLMKKTNLILSDFNEAFLRIEQY